MRPRTLKPEEAPVPDEEEWTPKAIQDRPSGSVSLRKGPRGDFQAPTSAETGGSKERKTSGRRTRSRHGGKSEPKAREHGVVGYKLGIDQAKVLLEMLAENRTG